MIRYPIISVIRDIDARFRAESTPVPPIEFGFDAFARQADSHLRIVIRPGDERALLAKQITAPTPGPINAFVAVDELFTARLSACDATNTEPEAQYTMLRRLHDAFIRALCLAVPSDGLAIVQTVWYAPERATFQSARLAVDVTFTLRANVPDLPFGGESLEVIVPATPDLTAEHDLSGTVPDPDYTEQY